MGAFAQQHLQSSRGHYSGGAGHFYYQAMIWESILSIKLLA